MNGISLSFVDFANRYQLVVALIDWRQLTLPCERQRVAVIAGWVRHVHVSIDLPSVALVRRYTVIIDLDTVNWSLLVHRWL